MKFKSYAKDLFELWCDDEGITFRQGAKRLGVSRTFLYMVFKHKSPCPLWLVKEFSNMFGLNQELISLHFGFFPKDLIRFAKDNPPISLKEIDAMLIKNGYRKPKTEI